MNTVTLIAFILGAGTIAFDHLVHKLPHWLAVVLYSAAVVLFIIGMIAARKTGG
ncbi:MAG: hypothetical protein IKH18_09780 [Clostridia bacterium]|nr:hypothetical protein [Clostridia bacterium]